ncbi:GIY-YIG nuclease family protein [Pseudenterobacter timonensis]|uniref:GIY-YIG nuclease family protein n=1 Tax=Pseudenterobacter timonensis TaxID=1755099 RepID=UPI00077B8493|nr:GIY-YIG nuclease family protein [Pseudenterobacter timonensis]
MNLFIIIVFLLALMAPLLAVILYKESKKHKAEITTLNVINSELVKELQESQEKLVQVTCQHAELEEKAAPLWQYDELHSAVVAAEEKINNADSIAKQKITEAEIKASKTLRDANYQAQLTISNANSEAVSITKDAREARLKAKERLDTANSKADELISNANDNAFKIIADAENRAKEIAGSAYEAKEFAETYKAVAESMKNKIAGYGDEWIIPNRSVLDELAENYEFTDAGKELQKARELTKSLIKTSKAANCDYVENNRRTTAIKFVLDAFNGKVDSTLSKIKHNNFGKLSQEIKDAFQLVNYNGSAFRSAQITDIYLQARLNELKWGVAVNEIMLEEKEEQRRIKEQLREEEKARREYEKAIKEAEKEEKAIQQAIDKATKDLLLAGEEQRLVLEQKLAELQAKYEEAEAKNQRAISMAQQTRSGHVYVISNIGSFGENVYKIGMTRRLEPLDRVRELGDASVPFSFDVHAMIYSDDAPSLEKHLHKVFNEKQVNKVNSRKEFFNVSIKDIKSTIEHMNINAHWTLFAEAKEYRESIAIENERIASVTANQELVVA